MADLFGKWVPTEWIMQVIDACVAAPQHNYLFLTKNPERYLALDKLAILPRKGNFWYGSTVTREDDPYFYSDKHNTFLSVEPMMGPMHGTGKLAADWVIVGAETGHRAGKIKPKREWVLDLTDECREAGVPVFMKENLVKEGVLEYGEIIRQRPDGLTFA
jgi:protein gp37